MKNNKTWVAFYNFEFEYALLTCDILEGYAIHVWKVFGKFGRAIVRYSKSYNSSIHGTCIGW